MFRILIVEDEDKLRKAMIKGLSEQGYDVVGAADGLEGLQRAVNEAFDCLILDRMLPQCDGLDVLRDLRLAGNTTPTILLTARGAIEDRVQGLDCGADDYLLKPFVWEELLARIRACIRRRLHSPETILTCGRLTLNRESRRLSSGERSVGLTIRQCELMEYLIRHREQNVTREALANEVWREPLADFSNVIDVYVSYLRKKLQRLNDPSVIRTIRGVGYRFEA